nr:SusE domain-containing protein [uncultured Flavobacterium sp.]
MKNIYKIFIAVAILTGLWSCENEENLMILEPQEAAFSIITPESGSEIILNEATPANTALTVTWEKVSYGAPTVVTYTVQLAAADTEFAAPVDVTSSTSTYSTIDVKELNTRALELGLAPNVEGTLDVRIKATTGVANAQPKFSDVITISVTPYGSLETPVLTLYLVGPATSAATPADGWNNSNNMPIFTDPNDNTKHYYTGYFNVGQFKLIEKPGQWFPAYYPTYVGDKIFINTSDAQDGNFYIATAGYYTLEINIKDLTYKLPEYTGSTATTYNKIAYKGSVITGDDSGWNTEVTLTKSTFDPHIWKASAQTLKAGKMLFYADNQWKQEWGPDIIVEKEGKYDIWFSDLDGRYTFIKVQ